MLITQPAEGKVHLANYFGVVHVIHPKWYWQLRLSPANGKDKANFIGGKKRASKSCKRARNKIMSVLFSKHWVKLPLLPLILSKLNKLLKSTWQNSPNQRSGKMLWWKALNRVTVLLRFWRQSTVSFYWISWNSRTSDPQFGFCGKSGAPIRNLCQSWATKSPNHISKLYIMYHDSL